jgi:hypothetical protein
MVIVEILEDTLAKHFIVGGMGDLSFSILE